MPVHIVPAPQTLTLGGPLSVGVAATQVRTLAAQLAPWAPGAAARLTDFLADTAAFESPSTLIPALIFDDPAASQPESAVPAHAAPAHAAHAVRTVNAVRDGDLSPEAYTLALTNTELTLRAADPAGALYGVNALTQALATADLTEFHAESAPRYRVRGFMLDVARHFFGVAEIKRVIDIASSVNLNRLHLHLSDDQGWRIEIDGRPELTKLASANDVDGGAGGYLNFDDYEEIQDYAELYGMTVVPEIDLPGHTNALLVAFPEAAPDGKPREPYAGIDVGFSWVHLTADATWQILDDVMGSLARRTHGDYLHIGGDEVLKVDRAEYETFMTRLAGIVEKHGKKLAGWHEVAGADLPAGSQVQFWTQQYNTDRLAALVDVPGIEVIASPAPHTYLDLKPVEDFPLGLVWAGLVPLRATFDWEPSEAVPVDGALITGVEACLWTETIRSIDDITTMMLPRIAGVASVAWGAPRDYASFTEALRTLGRGWAARGVAFYRDPDVNWD